jgi:hypothetical protein
MLSLFSHSLPHSGLVLMLGMQKAAQRQQLSVLVELGSQPKLELAIAAVAAVAETISGTAAAAAP